MQNVFRANEMNDKRSKKLFINGVILVIIALYLAVYFSMNSMWNAGTVFAIIIIAAVSALQFYIYYKFFVNSTVKKQKNKN